LKNSQTLLTLSILSALFINHSSSAIAASNGWNCSKDANNVWHCADSGLVEVTPKPKTSMPKLITPELKAAPTPTQIFTPEPIAKTAVKTTPTQKSAVVKPAMTAPVEMEKTETPTKAITAPALVKTPQTKIAIDSSNITPISYSRPSQSCSLGAIAQRINQELPESVAAKKKTSDKTRIEADSAIFKLEDQITIFSGNTRLRQDGLAMDADTLTYNRDKNEVGVEGNVVLQTSGITMKGESAVLNTTDNTGQMNQTQYAFNDSNPHGTAAVVKLNADETTSYEQLTYTTCQGDNADWLISADNMHIDREKGVGTISNAKLEFLGVPIAYVPFEVTFPIDKRRKSGFLVPSIGSNDRTGLNISAPYYFNLAPNYDATFTPRIMEKRGFMAGGEFRYLGDSNRGDLNAEFIADDSEYDNGSARGSLVFNHRTTFNDRLTAGVNLEYASDKDYFEDFGNELSISSQRFLERFAYANYNGGAWNISADVKYYQTLDKAGVLAANRPFQQLPSLKFDWEEDEVFAGFSVDMSSEFTYFDRDDGATAKRFDFNPALSYPMSNAWGFIEPKLGVRYTSYDLDGVLVRGSSSPDRTTATFSVDSGLFFDRETTLFNTKLTQTLEPRLFYLYTPEEDQTDIPVLDSSLRAFNSSSLFAENRFSGVDRVGDANQLTLALTSRFLDGNTSQEYLSMTIGQIYYFRDREVTAVENRELATNPEVVDNDSASPLIADVRARLSNNWNMGLNLEYDPSASSGELIQTTARVDYHDNQDRIFYAGYRLNEINSDLGSSNFSERIEQTDIAFIWPATESLNMIGRWNYSLENDYTVEAIAGFEYGKNCCWKLRTVARQFKNSPTDEDDLGIFVQLQLNGLTDFGDDISGLLENSIYSYGK